MKAYLDLTGLSRYNENIQDFIDDLIENDVITLIPSVGSISSGNTGYVTGGDVYSAIGDVESLLASI